MDSHGLTDSLWWPAAACGGKLWPIQYHLESLGMAGRQDGGWLAGWLDGCMAAWLAGWLDRWMAPGWLDGWLHGWMRGLL